MKINKEKKKELIDLYNKKTKHSNYQDMPKCLDFLNKEKKSPAIKRFERERMKFLLDNLDFNGKNILDVGGNTGFFSFESIRAGANKVFFIEGDKNHFEFVNKAKDILGKDIHTCNMYFNFYDNLLFKEKIDIVFLLNVVHHLGDDFGDKNFSLDQAKIEISKAIKYFNNKAEYLIFQMGFCWKGDRNLPIFKKGTKEEMINFIKESISDNWEIFGVGVAEDSGNNLTEYNFLNNINIKRDDSLGEFRNRPIFILKSIK